jgi:hypothetical protein
VRKTHRDFSKLSTEDADALLKRAARTDDDRAQDYLEERVGMAFCYAHPEYRPTPENGQKIESYIRAYGLPITLDSVELAFEKLKGELQ